VSTPLGALGPKSGGLIASEQISTVTKMSPKISEETGKDRMASRIKNQGIIQKCTVKVN
jgi:hypothetical protein